jgi:hypothetical protein
MAIVADYLVITKARFTLKPGGTTATERSEVSFPVVLPTGTSMSRGEPILEYTMDLLDTPGVGNQMGLAVDVNGTEVHSKLFLEGTRDAFAQAVFSGVAFDLAGPNTVRFRPVSPTNSLAHTITFSGVVLWFQRDSAAAG